jgi:hypothetical protein
MQKAQNDIKLSEQNFSSPFAEYFPTGDINLNYLINLSILMTCPQNCYGMSVRDFSFSLSHIQINIHSYLYVGHINIYT